MADSNNPGDLVAEAKALLATEPGPGLPHDDWQATIAKAQALLLMDLAYTMNDISETLRQLNVTMGRRR